MPRTLRHHCGGPLPRGRGPSLLERDLPLDLRQVEPGEQLAHRRWNRDGRCDAYEDGRYPDGRYPGGRPYPETLPEQVVASGAAELVR